MFVIAMPSQINISTHQGGRSAAFDDFQVRKSTLTMPEYTQFASDGLNSSKLQVLPYRSL